MDNNAFTGSLPHLLLHELNQTIVDQVTVNLANNQLTGSIPSAYLRFNSLDLDVTGNKISSIDSEICESDSIDNWMNGLVELYGCEAILCDVDYYLPTGKQEDDEVVCKWCDVGTDYMGSVSCASDVLSDLQILAEFYLAVDGPNWAEADGWDVMEQMETSADLTLPDYKDLDIDHCEFYGVECDDNDRVTELKLKGNSLEGLVPASLFDLPELTDLDRKYCKVLTIDLSSLSRPNIFPMLLFLCVLVQCLEMGYILIVIMGLERSEMQRSLPM